MNCVLFGFCGFLLVNVVFGQGSFAGSEIAKTHPDHPGKCWIEETQTSYSPGEAFIAKTGCREATCRDYENRLIILYRGCPSTRNQSNCKYVVKNPDAEFPACCPEIIC
ncbi:hypothetical protein HA402_008812 [Bradysia odoriphaga]|nr:hypothetical protein HA402_008812 [Bradysia odoriphaga]